MNNPEVLNELEFSLDGFDINEAFQGAMDDVVNDKDIELEEKIRRMEVIISEGTSEVYSDFVDFRAMAMQMQMACNHDHAMQSILGGSESLSGFMNKHSDNDGHNHSDDEYEIDPKTGKKTKKKKRKY